MLLPQLVKLFKQHAADEYVKHGRPTSTQSGIRAATNYLLEVVIRGDDLNGLEPTHSADPPADLPQLDLQSIDLEGGGGEPVRELAKLHVEQLTRYDMLAFRNHLLTKRNRSGQPWTAAHVNKNREYILKMVEWAEDEDHLSSEVHHELKRCKPIKAGKTIARRTKRVKPSDEAISKALVIFLRDEASGISEKTKASRKRKRDRLLLAIAVELLWESGMRPIELVVLRPCDVQLAEAFSPDDPDLWEYVPHEFKTEHTNDADRVIPFTDRAKELYDEAVALKCSDGSQSQLAFAVDYDPAERLFPWKASNPYDARTAFNRAIGKACDAAGLAKLTSRQFRHRTATDAAQLDARGAQHLLGHTHFSTTENYLHEEAKARRRMIEKLNRERRGLNPTDPDPRPGPSAPAAPQFQLRLVGG